MKSLIIFVFILFFSFNLQSQNKMILDNLETPESNQAIAVFTELARSHGVSPVTAALGWVAQVEGVASTIIGATSMEQLQQNIAAFAAPLPDALLQDLASFLRQYPMPF